RTHAPAPDGGGRLAGAQEWAWLLQLPGRRATTTLAEGILLSGSKRRKNQSVAKEKANGTTRNRCSERCAYRYWYLWWQLEGQTSYRVRGSCGPRGRQSRDDQTGRGGTRGVWQRDPYRYACLLFCMCIGGGRRS